VLFGKQILKRKNMKRLDVDHSSAEQDTDVIPQNQSWQGNENNVNLILIASGVDSEDQLSITPNGLRKVIEMIKNSDIDFNKIVKQQDFVTILYALKEYSLFGNMIYLEDKIQNIIDHGDAAEELSSNLKLMQYWNKDAREVSNALKSIIAKKTEFLGKPEDEVCKAFENAGLGELMSKAEGFKLSHDMQDLMVMMKDLAAHAQTNSDQDINKYDVETIGDAGDAGDGVE